MPLALTFVGTWPEELQQAAEQVFAAALAHLPFEHVPTGTINLKLVDDAESQRLNREYNGHDYATDVLTFSYHEAGAVPEGELADVAISTETALKQAAAAELSLPNEIALLVLHGVLHALGYDHQTVDQRQAVSQLQQTIMEAAGLTYREFEWKE